MAKELLQQGWIAGMALEQGNLSRAGIMLQYLWSMGRILLHEPFLQRQLPARLQHELSVVEKRQLQAKQMFSRLPSRSQ